jgi:GT2 family glycosyltransferase
MLLKKSTWLLIREQVREWTADKNILGVDTRISKAVRKAGLKTYLMKGMYLLHYYRMKNGENDKSILL